MHRHIRVLTALARLGIAVTVASLSHADAGSIQTWTLQNVTFASGQTANGSFTVDQGLGTVTDWNIQITGGSNPTLTNISFQPGGVCVAFCSELYSTFIPSPSGLDLRTPLLPDNTYMELNLYFNAPLSEILHPDVAELGLNGDSSLRYELLLNPTTVTYVERDNLSSGAVGPAVVVTPEPPSFILLTLGLVVFAILAKGIRNRKITALQ